MEQFSLEKYLENPSRKVVTRLKKSVQIISIEGKEDIPIIALVEGIAHQYKSNGFHADVVVAYSNQCRDMGDYDLFFADEEEDLTEFEDGLNYFLLDWIKRKDDYRTVEEATKESSKKLLNLARKEILKGFPMWKKCDDILPYSHIGGLNERYLIKNGYFIKISDLEILPKEE